MKSFKQYLLESKQSYEFKIKIAGHDLKACDIDKLKGGLNKFVVEHFEKGMSTPIQESHIDFPDHKNVSVTTYNLTLSYPATSFQIRQIAADALQLSECCIKVRNLKEQEEQELNHKYDEKSGESLLDKDYDNECNQHLVGNSSVMSLLKELNKVKHHGEQYTGVNDQLLAKSVPTEKPAKSTANTGCTSSVLGSNKVKSPNTKGTK